MKSTTSEKVIQALEECIDMLGIPYSITTDNGPQFISSEVEEYLARLDIKHHRTTPKWAQANGEVERQNRTLLKVIFMARQGGM